MQVSQLTSKDDFYENILKYFCYRADFNHAMENDIKPAFGAAAEVLDGYLSRGIINWGEPVQGE